MVDEAIATGGDVRQICDFFGVTVNRAVHYAEVVEHPALGDVQAADDEAPST